MYLLDTHTLLWALFSPERLPAGVRAILEDPVQTVQASAINFWEISLKYRLGKISFENFDPVDLPKVCAQMRLDILPLLPEEACSYHLVKADVHRDPFDRMLIHQALRRELILLSKDQQVQAYRSIGLRVFWE
jgi:PIN domain nuclease of toxin-antitoxin system